jgi:hypothetical protein
VRFIVKVFAVVFVGVGLLFLGWLVSCLFSVIGV